jgi:predicted Zn-dependent protease
VVFTDDMVKLFEADADHGDPVLVGVFAHELGHVQHRHGMRGVVQASLVGTATAVAFGDFSTLLAGVPAMLGQLGYSRDFEREADEASIRAMRADGTHPAAMIRLFDALAKVRDGGKGSGLGIALSSHPADEERVRRFRDASRGLPAAPTSAGS